MAVSPAIQRCDYTLELLKVGEVSKMAIGADPLSDMNQIQQRRVVFNALM